VSKSELGENSIPFGPKWNANFIDVLAEMTEEAPVNKIVNAFILDA